MEGGMRRRRRKAFIDFLSVCSKENKEMQFGQNVQITSQGGGVGGCCGGFRVSNCSSHMQANNFIKVN